MNTSEAKNILLQFLSGMCPGDEDHPEPYIPWVGELVNEDQDSFVFEGTIHDKGEDPYDDMGQFTVNKKTGQCMFDIEWVDPMDLSSPT